MTNEPIDTSEKDALRRKHTVREVTLATIGGALSGITAAITTTRDRFYSELPNWPILDRLFEQHGKELNAVTKKHIDQPFKGMAEEIGAIKDAFADKVEHHLLEHHGIHTRGFRGYTEGTLQRLELAGTRTKNKVLFNTVISTGLGAGAVLTFFNGMATRRNIETIAEQGPQQQR